MAGSLGHIVGKDGRFTMELIENLGDAYQALEECYTLIFELSGGDDGKVSAACKKHNFPDPWTVHRFEDDPMPDTIRIDPL